MPAVCFYFQVHQPYRIRKYSVFDIGKKHNYFESKDARHNNKIIFTKVAKKCYIPANKLLLKLLKKYPEFKVSFSLTGVFLQQAEEFYPEVIESFKKLVDTGRVELLSETFYHSLAFLYSIEEFKEQVQQHASLMKKLFGVTPSIFRNTELIYSNDIGAAVGDLGYKAVLAEGADHILGWKNPNHIYHHPDTNETKLLLKNYKLSDDIAFRFSNREWEEHPLSVDKFSRWINNINGNGQIVNLFMDYETFGEHQWKDTGIFQFLENLPSEILKHGDNSFVTPSDAVDMFDSSDSIDFPDYVSWADIERDLSAWRSNAMQHDAFEKLYQMEDAVKSSGNDEILNDWRLLQTSDHFYYMCTKWFNDGDVHKYFSPYESPYEAFINFSNALQDLRVRVEKG